MERREGMDSKLARPELNLLTENQIAQIHQATLKILETVGVKMQHPEARELIVKAGGQDAGNEIVKIPAKVIEEALQKAPSMIDIFSRDGQLSMSLTERNSYFGSGGPTLYIIDHQTGERRSFTIQDAVNLAKLVDACENLDFNMTMGHSSDIPVEIRDVHEVCETIIASPKPLIIAANDKDGLKDLVEIFYVIAGGKEQLAEKPFIIFYTEPISPLQHTPHSLDKLLIAVDAGLPVLNTPAPMAGATGPITLAGNLVVGNAELLSGLVLVQQRKPGAPFIYGGVFSTLDMSSTVMPYSSPELNLQSVATAELGRYYKLPTFGTAGCSDAHIYNQQAAFESGASIMTNILSGANLIHDIGWLEFANATSLDAILACDEMIAWSRRFLRGIEVTNDTLATDLIAEVGIGGNFIDTDLTISSYRTEQWFPKLFSRDCYENWEKAGKKTHSQNVSENVEAILKTHKPAAIDESKKREVMRLIQESDKRRRKQI